MMKKHEMVLDFTSLLDVILIILFLVLCSMNGKAQKDAKKIDDLEASTASLTSENGQLQGQIDDLEKQKSELEALLEEARKASLEKGQEVDRLTQENQKLEELLDTATQLAKTYEKLNGLSEADAKRFELLKYDTQAVTLRITKANTIDDYHYYVTLIADGIKSTGFMIEDVRKNDGPLESTYRYQKEFAEWLQNEMNSLSNVKEFKVCQINIDNNADLIVDHAFQIVKNAVFNLSEKDYYILTYDNGKKIG